MALIIGKAVKLYFYLNDDIADPRTQNWFLMRTPWLGVCILVGYLLAVYRWLPNYMKNRPPYDLRVLIAIYNFVQICCCSYVNYQSLKLGWFNHYSVVCQPVDDGHPNNLEYAYKVCYAYFFIKILDLLDTVFFILRKKQNQVTFLHVYHHCGMVAVGWGVVKWVPGGHVTLLLTMNSFVHVIMYTYYLLTAWDEKYKTSIWWKKHVTQAQIIQFLILLVHFSTLLIVKSCPFPPQPAFILIPQNLFMAILFSDFYYRTYIKPKRNQS